MKSSDNPSCDARKEALLELLSEVRDWKKEKLRSMADERRRTQENSGVNVRGGGKEYDDGGKLAAKDAKSEDSTDALGRIIELLAKK